jgi:hypothetical protein
MQLILSGNNLEVSRDLMERSLVLEFSRDAIPFSPSCTDPLSYSNEMILGALWYMVKTWKALGCPSPKGELALPRFPEWSRLVGGIMECNGMHLVA